jgi:DNA repair protein RadA/Sms
VSGQGEARRSTGLSELDRALGGGVVAGQVILVGGDPGVGKSTLLLQACASLKGERVLYVSGEESPLQIKTRWDRLNLKGAHVDVLAETDAVTVAEAVRGYGAGAAVVDSVQVLHHPDLEGAPGSVSQVRECASAIVRAAKESGTPVFLIGHVTKGGAIAGPKTLEHLVDTVLYFEGEAASSLRVLRAVKNRFGPTDEIAIFRMGASGLKDVPDSGGLFLGAMQVEAPGGAIVAVKEGRRVLLVELQALASPTHYAMPVRRVTGMDANRVTMIWAVLERWGGMALAGMDLFVNVTGGARIAETACDLGVAMATASSCLGRCLPPRTLVMGEVGLRGEVRPVTGLRARLSEAAKLGFEAAVVPGHGEAHSLRIPGLRLHRVDTLQKALALIRD